MLYKFKTRNAGDVIMTAPVGDAVLRSAGREPAAQGIFEATAMPAAISAIEAAIAAEDVRVKEAQEAGEAVASGALGLRQRAWPLLELLRKAHADGEPVVWGV